MTVNGIPDALIVEWATELAPVSDCLSRHAEHQQKRGEHTVRVCCRKAIIGELLQHANKDHMSSLDRSICTRSLELLDTKQVPELTGPITRSAPILDDLEEIH